MKYTIETTINIPRARFLELFQDTAFMKLWQPRLESIEILSGPPGQVGSKCLLTYPAKDANKPQQLIETIIYKDLPYRFDFTYEVKNVLNIAKNSFEENGNQTRWIAEHEFQFKGIMNILILMKGSFRKQTANDMNQFKEAAEKLAY